MTQVARLASFIALALLSTAGCGGTVVFEENGGAGDDGNSDGNDDGNSDGNDDGSGDGPNDERKLDCTDVRIDASVDVTETCASSDVCDTVGGFVDGRVVRQSCRLSTKECRLFLDGVEICTCPAGRIDFSNTCGNGVPSCAGWTFDRSDSTSTCSL